MGSKGEPLQAARVFFAGRLKPALDRVFPLAERQPRTGGWKIGAVRQGAVGKICSQCHRR